MVGPEQHQDDEAATDGNEGIVDAAANPDVERQRGRKGGEEEAASRSGNGNGWVGLNVEIEHPSTVGIRASRSRRHVLKIPC